MPPEETRRLAAVWFADIVGYTSLSERDEDAALALVGELQAISERVVPEADGRVVKFVGDAVLASFESAGRGVEAALRVRDAFQNSPPAGAAGAELRIGVHVGEITTAPDGDVYGDGVNTASRIQGVAAPGQVLLSSFALESVRHRHEFRTRAKGQRKLKGLSRPLDLFAVGRSGEEDPYIGRELPPEKGQEGPTTLYGRAIAVGLVAGMAGLVGLGVFAGAGPFSFTLEPDSGPRGEEVEVALSLGVEAYYREALEEAVDNLSLFLEPAGSREQRLQGLRYLARAELMAGDTAGIQEALDRLLSLEPPLVLLLPSLEDSALIHLYLDARRSKIQNQGQFEPSHALRELMLFDFQVFGPEMDSTSDETAEDAGYVVAFMLETELDMAGVPTSSVKAMSFQNRGDQAYVDLEANLASMNDEGPSHLLTGSVAINRTGALLSAWVYELETGRLVLSEQLTGSREDLLMTLPEQLATRITQRLMGLR